MLPGSFPTCSVTAATALPSAWPRIPPHNLREVCDAISFLLDKPDATAAELMKYITGPDFPTAWVILGTKGIKEAYETGCGRVIMQAVVNIEPMDWGKSAIVISELPYQVNKTRLIENIDASCISRRSSMALPRSTTLRTGTGCEW